MSTFRTQPEEDSPSSDEKMDTGSESFKSQDSTSDFEDTENVLRLQNPDVLRLAAPDNLPNSKDHRNINTVRTEHSNINTEGIEHGNINTVGIEHSNLNTVGIEHSNINTVGIEYRNILVNKEETAHRDINKEGTTNRNINEEDHQNIDTDTKVDASKNRSYLVLTTSHPLMGPSSPDYPDVVPKTVTEDLSISSIEDDKYNLYSPQTNTSKNNLYFSENFVTAENTIFSDSKLDYAAPDVARVESVERRKIASFLEHPTRQELSPHPLVGRQHLSSGHRPAQHSTPKSRPSVHTFGSGVAQWCESPTRVPGVPNFDLPIELSTNIAVHDGLASPDALSSPSGEASMFEALVDPATGRVAMRARKGSLSPTPQRRRIQLPPEDSNSLDSVSVSMDSEDEPPEPESHETHETQPVETQCGLGDAESDDDTKKSKSSSTVSSERTEPIPEYSAAEERRENRSWLTVVSGGASHSCDMKVIEPFKRVLSHGGYDALGAALIVLRACYLPDPGRPDYRYVMDNLFLYLMWSLERLVTDEYVLVVLHGRCSLPPPRFLHRCYLLVDRRLRKCLKHLYLVHPTFWIRSLVFLFKPFVSSKFFKKLTYVYSLEELTKLVPVDPNSIPDQVWQYETTRR